MSKQRIEDHRFDFGGGLNDHFSPVLLESNELQSVENAVVDDPDGALRVRLGSRRLHSSAIGGGASVTGVFQWENGGTKQLVAIANGDIFHKTTDFGAFSTVSPTPAMDTETAYFATNRANTSGAPLYLYIADGTYYWRWDGSALSQLAGTSSLPSNVDMVRTYHLRNFTRSTDFENNVYWTVLGDPEDGTQGLNEEGGTAMVDVLRGEGIRAMEVVGSSLLIGTPNSIVRFTGYDASDIQINQDTEGLSSTIGPVGRQALRRVEKWAAMISSTGVYAVSEAEVQLISHKWSTGFRELDHNNISGAVVAFHEGNREVWCAVPGSGDSGSNATVYVYHLDLGIWYGPHTYPFNIVSMCSWIDSNGDEYVVAGCDDGFVRVLDYNTAPNGNMLDDVLSSGSGGSAVTATVDLAPNFLGGPGFVKTTQRVVLHGIVGVGDAITLRSAVDGNSYGNSGSVIGDSSRQKPYRVDRNEQGERFDYRFVWNGTRTRIMGLSVYGHHTNRPSG